MLGRWAIIHPWYFESNSWLRDDRGTRDNRALKAFPVPGYGGCKRQKCRERHSNNSYYESLTLLYASACRAMHKRLRIARTKP
jgi:hypothetical protein